MATFSHSLTNPDALANMAREEHLQNADLRSAQFLYKKALENFVLHLPSWLGIAEVFNDQGNVRQAIDVLEFIHNRFSNGENTAWSKTLLAATLGQEQILTENLLWLLHNYPAKEKEVFALATISWEEPEILMNKFGKAYYPEILQEYIKHNELEKTMTVWEKMIDSGAIQQDVVVKYVDYLMDQNAFSLAAKVWSNIVAPDEPLLYNGDFTKPIMGSGFGWRLSAPKGSSWNKGAYGSGLEITFDGTENVSFQLSQILPLNPGEYIFKGFIETDDLTTDQLPFWMIKGEQCIGLSKQGEMVLPNQHATEFALTFVVPDNCELVRISLLRRTSYHFDNKIGGKIKVTSLSLQPREKRSSIPAQPLPNQIKGRQPVQHTPQKISETNISINKLMVQP